MRRPAPAFQFVRVQLTLLVVAFVGASACAAEPAYPHATPQARAVLNCED